MTAASKTVWSTLLLATRLNISEASATANSTSQITEQLSSAVTALNVPLLRSALKHDASQTQTCCAVLKLLLSLRTGREHTPDTVLMDPVMLSKTSFLRRIWCFGFINLSCIAHSALSYHSSKVSLYIQGKQCTVKTSVILHVAATSNEHPCLSVCVCVCTCRTVFTWSDGLTHMSCL